MALASLRFDAGKHLAETRQGFVIYNGAPSRFHEWEFRTRIKYDAVKDDDKKRKETVSSIVDSLDGDAATTAMDIGVAALMAEDGIEKLIERLKAKALPKLQSEAKELYRVGHEKDGLLSRQRGESMELYTARRIRWWKKLKSMDTTYTLSDTTLGELMLDACEVNQDGEVTCHDFDAKQFGCGKDCYCAA